MSGQKPVADLLAEIKKHEDDYQRLKNDGREAFSAGDYSSARDRFDQARAAHAQQFDSDNLAVWRSAASTLAKGAPGDRGSEPVLRSATNGPDIDANALGVAARRRTGEAAGGAGQVRRSGSGVRLGPEVRCEKCGGVRGGRENEAVQGVARSGSEVC